MDQIGDYVDEEDEQEVTPKQELLDKLLVMGYSQQVAKKALIMTKNSGIFKAIDLIPEIQAELKKHKAEQSKGKTLIDWSCPDCTFINMSNNLFCEVCELEAPESAYVALSPPNQVTPSLPRLPVQEPEKPASFAQAEVVGHFVTQSSLNRAAPLLVGVIRQLDTLHNIFVKQFGYTKAFLSEFYKEDEATGTLTCGVSGRSLGDPSERRRAEFVLDALSSFGVQSLGPLRANGPAFESKCELEIELEAQKVADFLIRAKEPQSDLQELVILCKRKEKWQILTYHIKMRSWLNSHMSFLQVKAVDLDFEVEEGLPVKIELDEQDVFVH